MLVENDGLSSVWILDDERCSLFLLRKLEIAIDLRSRAVRLAARRSGATDSWRRASSLGPTDTRPRSFRMGDR